MFTQTGGSVGAMTAAGTQAVGLFVGGNWTTQAYNYVQSATTYSSLGSYTLGNANGTGSPLFVGGCEVIGATGTGTFTQNCGTNAIIGGGKATSNSPDGTPFNNSYGMLILGYYGGRMSYKQFLGNGVGTYVLNGGLLTGGPANPDYPTGDEYIGVNGTGIFTQNGGTNVATQSLSVGGPEYATVAGIFITNVNPAYGQYTLNNGLLVGNLDGGESVGAGGTGIFTQTGGTNLVNYLTLGGYTKYFTSTKLYTKTTPGTYNLNGGVLQAADIGIYSYYSPSPATFNFTGGTLQAAPGGLNLGVPVTVGTDVSNVATFDANGQTVTLQNFSGPGQVRVISSAAGGTVVFGDNTNTYTGGTTVLSGTLEVLNAQTLPNVGVLTVGGPGQVERAEFNLNGTQQTTEGLVTASSLVPPDLNFQTPGVDLITIGDLGMNIAPNTAITFGTNPTALGDYELMTGNITGFNAANFVLPTAPAGDRYSLQVVAGNVDLVVAAVPEPGTLALLGAGLVSLLGLAWRWRPVGQAPRA